MKRDYKFEIEYLQNGYDPSPEVMRWMASEYDYRFKMGINHIHSLQKAGQSIRGTYLKAKRKADTDPMERGKLFACRKALGIKFSSECSERLK